MSADLVGICTVRYAIGRNADISRSALCIDQYNAFCASFGVNYLTGITAVFRLADKCVVEMVDSGDLGCGKVRTALDSGKYFFLLSGFGS